MKAVYWGTYDLLKPRNRLMIKGLMECGVDVYQCHADVWAGVEDKTQIDSLLQKIVFLLKWFFSYPFLMVRYLFLPKHQAVFVGYMGLLDVILLWPLAKIRSVPIIFDPFVSCYNTVVEDRKILSAGSILATVLFSIEKAACTLADALIVDTDSHGEYFVEAFQLQKDKVNTVFVGAEGEIFFPPEDKKALLGKPFTVLFYGQFSPLHGVDTVLKTAELLRNENIDWLLIGRGQEADRIAAVLESLNLSRVKWIDWVPYEQLNTYLQRADVCIGILGDTEKAQRVIPNKVFQAIAAGCPIITQDSPAMRELVSEPCDGIKLLNDVSPAGLAEAIGEILKNRNEYLKKRHFAKIQKLITAKAVGEKLITVLDKVQRP